MGYTKNALKGVSWMSASRVITRLLAFAKIAVLARVLSPAQFGIFGIASLVLALLETLTETGINIVLIQSKKKLSDHVDSAWVVSIIRGVAISVILLLSAPFISSFFNSKDALDILLFMSLVPLVRGFINPSEIKFQKELNFKSEFLFRTSIFFFDAFVAIILATLTHSVYSLVWGLLAGALFEVSLSFIFIKPTPKFIIHKEYFSEIFHKGKWVTGYTILNYIAENGDDIVVGKIMNASALGLYQMAYKISILPISEVSDVVSKVVFPVYAKISDDVSRLRRAFLKTVLVVSSTSIFIGLIVFLFPEYIVLILLGEKWLAVVPVLKVLAIYGALRAAIAGPGALLFLAFEKQNYVTTMTFVRFAGLAVSIYPLVQMYGLIGAGYSALISVLVEIPIVLYFTLKILRKSSR